MNVRKKTACFCQTDLRDCDICYVVTSVYVGADLGFREANSFSRQMKIGAVVTMIFVQDFKPAGVECLQEIM